MDASLGTASFPTKVYGDLVYPAGEYEALRVVIGEGSGANWWCVMFPPLCFVDVSSGVVSESETVESTDKTSADVSTSAGEKTPIDDSVDETAVDVSTGDISTDDEVKPPVDDITADNEEKTVVYTFKIAQVWEKFRDWISNLFA